MKKYKSDKRLSPYVMSAMRKGKVVAGMTLEEHNRITGGRKYSGENGILVAEGDSWFAYPWYNIVIYLRSHFKYEVHSVAENGDTLEDMAYNYKQKVGLVSKLTELSDHQKTPRAILLSVGGNDIAGPELQVMLNHRMSGSDPLNSVIANEVINNRLRYSMITLISAVSKICDELFGHKIPILIHGYSHPVPDGRSYWKLRGPWLKPSFDIKGYLKEELEKEKAVMKELINLYNTVLTEIAQLSPFKEYVRYVGVVPLLSSAPKVYKQYWENELHPTRRGFKIVAAKFNEVLKKLP